MIVAPHMAELASLGCRCASRTVFRLSSSSGGGGGGGSSVRIIFEDDCLLVADKAPHSHSQPGNLATRANILDDVKAYIHSSKPSVGNIYLGSVNRLDFQVGGCMLFAKTQRASRDLNEQFRERAVDKVYYAICQAEKFDHLMAADEQYLQHVFDSKSKATNAMGELRYSLEQLVVVKRRPCALIRIRLITGFKHQVRIMMSSCLGAPVAGDAKYRSSVDLGGHLLLHAHALSFDHPRSGERLAFSSPLPALWSQLTKTDLNPRGL